MDGRKVDGITTGRGRIAEAPKPTRNGILARGLMAESRNTTRNMGDEARNRRKILYKTMSLMRWLRGMVPARLKMKTLNDNPYLFQEVAGRKQVVYHDYLIMIRIHTFHNANCCQET